jgi:hypothetical protein
MRAARLYTIALVLVLAVCWSDVAARSSKEAKPHQDKPAGFYLKPDSVQKEITFKTVDGWTIYGTYTIPSSYKSGEKLPAVLFLHVWRTDEEVCRCCREG